MSDPAMQPGSTPNDSPGGLERVRQLIARVADGAEPVATLIGSFRGLHETIERAGRPQYRSKDEARLIWDVLWALEFYSPDPSKENNPAEWNDAGDVLAEVQRVNRRLQEL